MSLVGMWTGPFKRIETPLFAFLLLAACQTSPEPVPIVLGEHPNVLLVSVCSWRRDHIGVYGYQSDVTPALDKFSEDAVVFDDAWANASITDASHASIFTGLYPGNAGVLDFGDKVKADVPTLPEILGFYGYRVQAFLTSNGPSVSPNRYFNANTVDDIGRGFGTPVLPENLAEELSTWVGAEQKPWLAWVHLRQAHLPYGAGASFNDPIAPEVQTWLDDQTGVHKAPLSASGRSPMNVFSDALKNPDIAKNFNAIYDSGIHAADAQFGEILDLLGTRQQLENTLIIFVGDHGEMMGEASRFGHQGLLMEPVLRVPLLIHLPQTPARRETARVSLVDLLPTLTELLKVVPPANLDGHSLVPALMAQKLPAHAFVAQALGNNGDPRNPFLQEAFFEGPYWLAAAPSSTILWKETNKQWFDVSKSEAEQLNTLNAALKAATARGQWRGTRSELPEEVKVQMQKNGYW